MRKVTFTSPEKPDFNPTIHCRFSMETMQRIVEITEVTGSTLNRTIATLVETILPYVQIETVTEPHQVVSITLPGKEDTP